MNALLWTILHASWHAALLTVVVLVAQAALRRHLPARWRFALWFLVLVRLSLVPLPESRWSLYNWLPAPERATHLLAESHVGAAPLTEGQLETLAASAVAVAPAGGAGHRVSAADVLMVIYVGGVAVILLRMMLAAWALRRIVASAEPVMDAALLEALDAARRAVGLRRLPRMKLSRELASPAVVGMLRPCLLVPPEVLAAFSAAELRFVFLHECTHIRRNDVALNYWLALAAAVHWFNPVVWFLLPRVRADRELACDETVLLHTGQSAAYGETLLKLIGAAPPARPLAGAVGVVESRSFFKRRIRMIAAFRRTPAWLAMPALGVAIVFAGATLTSAVSAVAQTAANAAGVHASPATQPANGPSAEEVALRQRLDSRLQELSTDGQSLDKVLAFLADQGSLNMVVNWNELGSVGVSRDTKVSVKLANVTYRKALDAILMGLKSEQRLTYAVEDNILTISTAAELEGADHDILRVYNVRDLLATPDAPTPVESNATAPGVFSNPAQSISPEVGESALVETLQASASPNAWRDHGGSVASMRIYKGLLVITAPAAVHEQLFEVLKQLRAAMKDGHG